MVETNLIVPKDHISITSVNDVNAICAPLFQHTDIDFLWYARYYPDDSVIVLSSNLAFNKHMLNGYSSQIGDWEALTIITNKYKGSLHQNISQPCWLVEDVTTYNQFSSYKNEFNIASGIELAEKLEDCYELFWFDSLTGKNLVSFYLNNFDVLEKFILYFRETAADLIKLNEKNKVIVPNRDPQYKIFLQQVAQNTNLDRHSLQTIYNDLALKKYPLHHDGKQTYITARELDCLRHSAQGNSQKEIGNILDISDRTVETYLENVKRKLGVYSKKQMLDVFRCNRLSRIHFH